jgi:peptidoglycan hydrolase-like protein with peptidoglycan-binding domain
LFWLPLVLVWVLPVAGIALLVPAARDAQQAELSAAAPKTTVVGETETSYRQAVDVTVTLPDPVPVKSNVAGVVTHLDVHEGDSIANGAVIAAIDTVPVHAWRSGVPLFRDLAKGDRGSDVKAAASFLVNQRVLDPKLADDRFGAGMDKAVRAFQRKNRLHVDGIFKRAWLAYVPKDVKAVGSLAIRVDARVAVGDTLFSGHGAPTSIRFAVAGGATGETPRLPAEKVVLQLGEAKVPVSSTTLGKDERATVATALAEAATKGAVAAQTDGNTTTYTGPVLIAATTTKTGSVPGTAVYVTTGGTTCVFATTDTGAQPSAVPLPSAELAETLGQVSVPADLVGRTVVADPLTLDAATLATCD